MSRPSSLLTMVDVDLSMLNFWNVALPAAEMRQMLPIIGKTMRRKGDDAIASLEGGRAIRIVTGKNNVFPWSILPSLDLGSFQ